MTRVLEVLLTLLVTLAPVGAASAQEAASPSSGAATEWRPYVFATDAATLRPWQAAVESGVGYNGVVQPEGIRLADGRRFDTWITGAVGLTGRLELAGTLVAAEAPGSPFQFGEGRVELRARVLDWHRRFPVELTLAGGYQSDGRFQSAAELAVAATISAGRFALTVDARALHYFHDGRDPIDFYVNAGASVRATRWLRVGLEYVGEELEEARTAGALTDGGSRNYVGPSAAVFLLGGHVRLNATGGVVVAPVGIGPLARGSIAYVF
jgi:hypothetical protein